MKSLRLCYECVCRKRWWFWWLTDPSWTYCLLPTPSWRIWDGFVCCTCVWLKDLQRIFSLESWREKGDGCIWCPSYSLLARILYLSVKGILHVKLSLIWFVISVYWIFFKQNKSVLGLDVIIYEQKTISKALLSY